MHDMEKKFYQDDFEQFLQDEVKQHRMYPSDHIWKNIRTDLHGYRSWPALTFISLFIITALTISTLISNHPQPLPAVKTATTMVTAENIEPASHIAVNHHEPAGYFEKIAPDQITAEAFAGLATPETDLIVPAILLAKPLAAQPELTQFSAERTHLAERILTAKRAAHSRAEQVNNTLATVQLNGVSADDETVTAPTIVTADVVKPEVPTTAPHKTENHATADDYLKDFGYTSATVTPRRNARFGFQLYVTPSTSYRRLSDEKVKDVIQPSATAAATVPLSNGNTDVNKVVRHKPAVGLELGFAMLYTISPRLKFKTGLQLNVRQYYIETFQSLTSDLATLSLINYRGVETISFYSPYNNNTGYRQTQLDNKVYQLSVPMGIQWDVIRGRHFGVNTEASIQPTMTLNNSTYLLSADYKHYTDGDPFIRKWNVNTAVGFNLTYKMGSSSWQLGPQVRYQHLPTYSNAYPIKEYLMDYGVRLAFTKQLK